MNQSRVVSLIETSVSTFIGWFVSFAISLIVLPLYFGDMSVVIPLELSIIYTIASMIRQYGVRRLFNRIHHKLEALVARAFEFIREFER